MDIIATPPPSSLIYSRSYSFEPSQLSKKQTHIDTTTNITGIKPFTYSLLVGVKRVNTCGKQLAQGHQ